MIDGIDIPLETWGGLVLDANPQNLPPGVSPDCQNLTFTEVGPRTRPGLGSGVFPAIFVAGNPSVNYVGTFVTPTGIRRFLCTDSLFNMWRENPTGTLELVTNRLLVESNMLPVSASLFGREWFAMGDGLQGVDIPRQYSEDASTGIVYLDRVSQGGPGASCTVADKAVTVDIEAAGAGAGIFKFAAVTITAISMAGSTVTVTAAVNSNLQVGDKLQIAGVTNASYDGTFPISAILGPGSFQYIHPTFTDLAASSGGTYAMALFSVTSADTDAAQLAISDSVVLAGAAVGAWDGNYMIRNIILNTGGSTAGPNAPGTAAQSGASYAWSNVNNIKVQDGSLATEFLPGDPGNTPGNWLEATNFGFAIPGGSTITGIKVEVKRKQSTGTSSTYGKYELVNVGTIAAKFDYPNAWTATLAFRTFGNAADTWGASALTVANVNNAAFGVRFFAQCTGLPGTGASIGVDFVRITVFYTGGASGITTFILDSFPTFALPADSGSGTLSLTGQSSAGDYKFAVCFVTRQGYITVPSPPGTYTSAGNGKKIVTDIPIGPPNIVQRIILFTGAGGGNYFYIPAGPNVPTEAVTVIGDNTTTSAIFDFSDVELFAGVSADALFRLIVLGECAGVIDYGSRLVWWGELNKLNNFLNMGFDGGKDQVTNYPLGWTVDSTDGAGGQLLESDGGSVSVWQGAYWITGDGATAIRGMITQSAYRDAYGVPLIEPNKNYSVRIRAKRVIVGPGAGAPTLRINLYSSSAGINTTGLAQLVGPISAFFRNYEAKLTDVPLTSVPSDLLLRVYVDGTLPNNWVVGVDEIEVFPTEQPVNTSLLRISRPDDPESYDGVNGFALISDGDGWNLASCFKLRDERLYVAKLQGLHSTQDDGVNEPAGWSVDIVSQNVGAASARAIATGEDWAILSNRRGAYIFWGPEPVKISAEIQPLWDRINWANGKRIWSKVNTQGRRVYIGVPLDGEEDVSTILHMDYQQLDDAPDIAGGDPIRVSGRGAVLATNRARKWVPWPLAINSCNVIERPDGTGKLWMGGQANGLIFQVEQANLNDNGVAINAYYQTSWLPGVDKEEQLPVGFHRKVYTYLTMFVEGAGNLKITAYSVGSRTAFRLPLVKLRNPESRDRELLINLPGLERCSFRFALSGVDNWFRIARLCSTVKADAYSLVRGF